MSEPERQELVGVALREAFDHATSQPVDNAMAALMIRLSQTPILKASSYSRPFRNRTESREFSEPQHQEEKMERDVRGNGGRGVIIVVAVLIVVAIIAVATGFVNLSGDAGRLPEVSVNGGRAPNVDADVGSVDVGTTKAEVTVPTVGTKQEQVDVPAVSVTPAKDH